MARHYSPSELDLIFRSLSGGPLLYVPAPSSSRASGESGPAFQVRVTYSEFTRRDDAAQAYWTLLRALPVDGTVAILTGIINVLDGRRTDPALQQELEDQFASAALREHIRGAVRGGRARSSLFGHLSAVLAIYHVIAYGNSGLPNLADTPRNFEKIGELFLFANEFFDPSPAPQAPLSDMDLMLITVPTWDLLNRRNLAHTMARTYSVLTEALQSNGPEIANQQSRVFGSAPPTVNGLSVEDFRAIVFGIYSWTQNLLKTSPRLVFDRRDLLRNFPAGQPALDAFTAARARTVNEFRTMFGAVATFEEFESALRADRFLAGHLKHFRQFPCLRLDNDRFAILDLTFLAELLSQGVYWTIYDGLPSTKREAFRQLWGLAFERYACELLGHFYPPASQLLRTDVPFAGGKVDALLDFVNYVPIIEIKSSLLTEGAKRGGQRDLLLADIDKKFVRNELGKPKGVAQLAAACSAMRAGQLGVANPDAKIFPILVSDEVCAEAPGFNSYLNGKFNAEMPERQNIAPLTVVSIGELEELLPYTSGGRFDLPKLFSTRFTTEHELLPVSVHQSLYDLPDRGEALRNEFVEVRFSSIRDHVNTLFQAATGGSAGK